MEDLSPHGLLEKVLCPFVVHSQIWPLGIIGGDAGCICAAMTAGAGNGGVAGIVGVPDAVGVAGRAVIDGVSMATASGNA